MKENPYQRKKLVHYFIEATHEDDLEEILSAAYTRLCMSSSEKELHRVLGKINEAMEELNRAEKRILKKS